MKPLGSTSRTLLSSTHFSHLPLLPAVHPSERHRPPGLRPPRAEGGHPGALPEGVPGGGRLQALPVLLPRALPELQAPHLPAAQAEGGGQAGPGRTHLRAQGQGFRESSMLFFFFLVYPYISGVDCADNQFNCRLLCSSARTTAPPPRPPPHPRSTATPSPRR